MSQEKTKWWAMGTLEERVQALRAVISPELEAKLRLLREEDEKLAFGHFTPERKLPRIKKQRTGYHHKIKGSVALHK